jgi:hypothetical protein
MKDEVSHSIEPSQRTLKVRFEIAEPRTWGVHERFHPQACCGIGRIAEGDVIASEVNRQKTSPLGVGAGIRELRRKGQVRVRIPFHEAVSELSELRPRERAGDKSR